MLQAFNRPSQPRVRGVQATVTPTCIAVREEQAVAVRASSAILVAGNCFIGASVVAVIYDHAPHGLLLAWLVAVFVGNAARGILIWRPATAATTLCCAWVGALGMGFVWIAPLLLCDDLRSAHGTFIIFMVGGITASAVVQGRSYAAPPIAFVAPLLCALLLMALGAGLTMGFVFCLNILLYFGLLVRNAVQSELDFSTSCRRRIEALSLADSLGQLNNQFIEAEGTMRRLATVDGLTGLLNRTEFLVQFEALLNRTAAEGEPVALMLLDLDGFKTINDTLGHAAGDAVLIEVASCIRAAAPGHAIAARLGGDEFAIAVPELIGPALAEALLTRIGAPMPIVERRLQVGVSIGLAAGPADGRSGDALMKAADLALYAAKNEGRNRFRHFDDPLRAAAALRMDLERDLPGAIADGSLQVWFQPQVSLLDGSLVGVEALIRWNHPARGWIAPPKIIEAALAIRASQSLTTLVLLETGRLWRHLVAAGLGRAVMAVNVSPREIGVYDLPACIRTMLDEAGMRPDRLEVEITEEAMLDTDRCAAVFRGLRTMGVRIAVDDFGTGYSSLAHLRTLKVDRIKIDRSFVTGLRDHPGDQVLVQAILGIGEALAIEVVAEGIESPADVQALRLLGCPIGQGYHYGRPMPAGGLLDWATRPATVAAVLEPVGA